MRAYKDEINSEGKLSFKEVINRWHGY